MSHPGGKDILTTEQFSKEEAWLILRTAEMLECELEAERSLGLLRGYLLATLFFEPSTRTGYLSSSDAPLGRKDDQCDPGDARFFGGQGRVFSGYCPYSGVILRLDSHSSSPDRLSAGGC
jgi:hypothetical protein